MPATVKKVPRYVEMTPEREEKIDKLLEKIKREIQPPPLPLQYAMDHTNAEEKQDTPHNPVRVFAYAYLVSRQWNVDKAFEFVQAVTAFRRETNLESSRQLPAAFSIRGWDQEKMCEYFGVPPRIRPARVDKVAAGIEMHFQCGLHYWDKAGLPVLYMMVGNTDEVGLLKKLKQLATVRQRPADVLWEYVQHGVAGGEAVTMYQQHLWESGELAKDGSDASAGIIRSFTLVVDCSGLSYKMLWKPAVDLLNETLKRIFAFWPDVIHRILAINTPPMVMFAYNIVKGALDEGVQRKISFYKPKESPEALRQVIDVKYIPKFLGGECECEGYCIHAYDPANPKAISKEDDDTADVVTEDITLKAGKRHEKIFHLRKDETVFWDFATTSGKDVNFGLYFVPATEAASGEEKISPKRLEPFTVRTNRPSEGTDSFHAPEDGTLILVWDNKGSWFTAKALQMRVYKQAVDGIRNSNDELVPAVSSGHFVPPAEALAPDAPVPRGGVGEEEARNRQRAQRASTSSDVAGSGTAEHGAAIATAKEQENEKVFSQASDGARHREAGSNPHGAEGERGA